MTVTRIVRRITVKDKRDSGRIASEKGHADDRSFSYSSNIASIGDNNRLKNNPRKVTDRRIEVVL